MSIWDESPPPTARPDPTLASPLAANGPSAGSDNFEASEPPEESTPWWGQQVAGIPAWLLLAIGLIVWGVVAYALFNGGDDGASPSFASIAPPASADGAAGANDTTTTTAGEPTAATPAPTTTNEIATDDASTTDNAGSSPSSTPVTTAAPAPSTAAAATVPATTAPATTAPPSTTVAPATTAPPTTATTTTTSTTLPPASTTTTSTPATTTTTTTTAPATSTTTTTLPPTWTISEASTVTGDSGESLTVTPRRDECRYGPDCFVVSFDIDGFAQQPQEFVCEFSSGARYVFKFSSAGADPACSSLDKPETVVVEVAGLRSEPVTITEG